MTDEEIDRLATRVIQRMQPPVLVMVTAADAYRPLIRTRLAASGLPLHMALDKDLPDGEQWQAIGQTVPVDVWHQALPVAPWRAVLLPFLDYALAAELVNGNLHSPVARRLHDALLAGIPVLALRYHCDPASELNQLRGTANAAYAEQMQTTLARLQAYGVTLCTMNVLMEKLTLGVKPQAALNGTPRYLTVTDMVNNPALASTPDARLTDAAVDYLKKEKNNLTLMHKPGVK